MSKLFGIALALAAALSVHASTDFVMNNSSEPQSLDPALTSGVPESRLSYSLFEGLVVNDAKTSEPVPALADKWTISADKKTYTFHIRPAKWSDGNPITAQDFVNSWLRVLDPKTASPYAYLLGDSIEGARDYNAGKGAAQDVKVKAVDAQDLQVTFVGPLPYALNMLTHNSFTVTPSQVIAKYGAEWVKPEHFVGSGPFMLKSWRPQDRIVVVKNPNYWDAKNVKLDSITYLPIEDQNVAYDKFKAGEIDYLPDDSVPVGKIDEIKLRKDYQHLAGSSVYYFIFNTTRKPFDDVRVRKALAMGVNRQDLVDKVLKAGDVASPGLVPAIQGYQTTKGNGFDLTEAKKLLAEAGYPNGQGFPKVELIYNTSARHKLICEYIQQAWKANLGVDIELKNLEWNTFLDTRQKSHDFLVARAGWLADYPDAGNYLDMFRTGSGNNDGLYSNKQYDKLMTEAALMAGGPKRNAVMEQAEAILIDKDQAVSPWFFYVNKSLVNQAKWGGVYANAMDIHPTKWIFKK
jgi:oligopeptide transport system substrate-binding protein